ncbi:ATP-binding cassette domain-containing protein [Nonomuraea sp. NPDC003754]
MIGPFLRNRNTAALLAWSALDSLPVLLSGICVTMALDRGFLSGRRDVGLVWIAALGAALAVRAITARRINERLADLVEPIRVDLVRRVVRATVSKAVREPGKTRHSAIAQITSQVDAVCALTGAAVLAVRDTVLITGAVLIGLTALKPVLALATAVPVTAALLLLIASLRTLAARQAATITANEEVAQESAALLLGLRDILACGAQPLAAERMYAAVERLAGATRGLSRSGTVRAAVLAIGGYLPLLALVGLAAWQHATGGMQTGVLLGVATYIFAHLLPMLRATVQNANSVGLPLLITVRRLREATRVDEVTSCRGVAVPAEPDLRLERIAFTYGRVAEPIVCDLSVTVPFGRHVAIVGPSGVGKSTLARLMCGLSRPSAGAVLLGEQPIQRLDGAELSQAITLVPQDAYIFTGTVRENLAYLAPQASTTTLTRSAEAVGAAALIERLGGLDAALEPSRLSEGERQLIALTRAHASAARMVILDEATNHLDSAAEEQAEDAFAKRGGTLIVIAHRLSSALRADMVIVIDDAQVQWGTHEELRTASPCYARLLRYWNTSVN